MHDDLDVLVIGSGIAGIVSGIEAARNGASVSIACAGPLFGGSSFYPGTWGLGLIGPESEEDEDDLIATIEEVGCGMASHALVETFVRGLRPAIAWLEEGLGVGLKRPSSAESAREATFIPCFDHKSRMWRGITRDAFEEVTRRHIADLDIDVLERSELMQLVRGEDGAIVGAILFDRRSQTLFAQHAKAIVLCCGGTGGLFERSLTSRDVLSSAHGIALDAGCDLINIEFMQMMPGLVSPARGIVFNEKTFRYAIIDDSNGILPANADELADLLETRSGHGPFTCRLGDEAIDMAIDAAGEHGIAVRFDFPRDDVPEFVQTFSQWMHDELGFEPSDELRVAMYAHAANGGIRIDEHARTGVPGLFACGEVTGGMHGADRIGGLSSANGLVFGRIAGRGAAACANEPASRVARPPRETACRGGAQMIDTGVDARGLPHLHGTHKALEAALDRIRTTGASLDEADAHRITAAMRHAMSSHAMIRRSEEGLSKAIDEIVELQSEVRRLDARRDGAIPVDASLARGMRLTSQLGLANAMLRAMEKRNTSVGPHYRVDRGDDSIQAAHAGDGSHS